MRPGIAAQRPRIGMGSFGARLRRRERRGWCAPWRSRLRRPSAARLRCRRALRRGGRARCRTRRGNRPRRSPIRDRARARLPSASASPASARATSPPLPSPASRRLIVSARIWRWRSASAVGQIAKGLGTDQCIPGGDGIERAVDRFGTGGGAGIAQPGIGRGDAAAGGAEIEQPLIGADRGIGAAARHQPFDNGAVAGEIARQRAAGDDRQRQLRQQPRTCLVGGRRRRHRPVPALRRWSGSAMTAAAMAARKSSAGAVLPRKRSSGSAAKSIACGSSPGGGSCSRACSRCRGKQQQRGDQPCGLMRRS